MTSATLFREGTDLESLLAELDEQYDGQIRVVEVNHTREGGVLGFFARPRVAVHFTVAGSEEGTALTAQPPVAPVAEPTDSASDPLDALIAAAEMVETGQALARSGVETAAGVASTPSASSATASAPAEIDGVGNVEFARMLLDIAARKAAERGVELPVAERAAVTAPATAAPTAPTKASSGSKAAAPVRAAVEFEALTPTVEVTKPKAVRVAKPKTSTAAKSGKATSATNAKATKPATKGKSTKAVTATSSKTTSAVKTTSATKPVPATKTETAAAVEATIAAVGQSLRAELSIADLHEPDERLTLRRRLSELGVPFDRIPTDTSHRYAAVEQLVQALPGVAPLPESGGQLVVVAGPSAQVAATAELMIKRMSLLPWQVWAYRCPGIAALPDREIRDAGHAATVAARARRGAGEQKPQPLQSTLVVIGLDEFETDQLRGGTTAASIVRALVPDAFWLHVDATRKASDTSALVRELGIPTALIVSGAARTASPASVWELDVPVALLDGRPATPAAWAVLLLDKLADAAA